MVKHGYESKDNMQSPKKRLLSMSRISRKFKRKTKTQEHNLPPIPFLQLFRYSDKLDKFLMVVGLVAAVIQGSALPIILLVFGRVTDSFILFASCGNSSSHNCTQLGQNVTNRSFEQIETNSSEAFSSSSIDVESVMTQYAYYYVIIASGVVVCGFVQVYTWVLSSNRQTRHIRHHFFHAIMRQEMEWFDIHETGRLSSRMNEDVTKIGDSIGEKFVFFVSKITTFIGGFVVGFVSGWQLTLVILAVTPLLGGGAAVMSKFIASWTTKELKAYAKAGALVEGILLNIRTVVAYGAETKEVERYNKRLHDAEKQGVRKGMLHGIFQGFMWAVIFLSYALAFWYGSTLVLNPDIDFTAGKLLTVFFGVLVGAVNLGQASSSLDIFMIGRSAAALVYHIIEKESKIDALSDEGIIPDKVVGEIAFKDVQFHYSSRPSNKILNDVNVVFEPNQTTVLVGPSGMGKSTIIRLIQRLYDPCEGKVTLDGEDIRNINVRWLRKTIGVVQQEPTLFATTISENIRFGLDGATEDDVINSAKAANAYNFIMELPEKFETMVGMGGCQLSGGQKQRVAIARALIRNPRILLLDQACSALDTESEAVVLQQLKNVQKKCTIIMVAHRLSTVSAADVIVGIEHGRVVEKGNHDELMLNHGVYFTLATMQQTSDKNESQVVTYNDDQSDDGQEVTESRNNYTSIEDSSYHSNRHQDNDSICVGIKEPWNDDVKIDISECDGDIEGNEFPGTEEEEEEEEEEDESQEEEEDDVELAPTSRILRLNWSEYPYIILGTIGAVINGASQPLFAILLSGMLGVFAYSTAEEVRLGVNFFCILMCCLAAASFVTFLLQQYMFAKSGEILTRRIRKMAFAAILRQNVGWFDDAANGPGALSSRLSTDAGRIQGAAGAQIGMIVSTITTVTGAMIIAFYYGWKLALIELSFFPFVILAQALQIRMIQRGSQNDKKSLAAAGRLVMETLGAFSSVVALGKELYFSEKYNEILRVIDRHGKKMALVYGLTFGIANSFTFFSHAATFRFGAYLVVTGEMTFDNIFRVFFVIVFVGISLGKASAYTPDYAKARKAATRIFQLLDRAPAIDVYSDEGEKWDNFKGKLKLQNCEFTYPARPDSLVLRGLDVTIESGQTLAFVGQSGCGKSTSVQLLERFYDPDAGQVLVDDRDVRGINLKFLRSKIGIVFQDPVLFEGSVFDNIVYGDCGLHPTTEEVHEAAKLANIHDFISSLVKGYDTDVGNSGNSFSRGQKQRIAIARALVRKPSILLLDEATSALDTENEKIVQEALDKARLGRTTIMIAHRLSTIKKADKIAVMSQGKIVEQGTHDELMQKKEAYYKLVTTNASLS